MKVLITGANGQVGHELLRLAPEGFEVIGLGSSALDITDAGAVAAVFAREQPQLVINAAAYTAVDKAEHEMARAYAVNCDALGLLGQAASKIQAPVLHISTDYVFPGDAERPYSEMDATGPTGVYGASKLAGERLLAQVCPHHLIMRTSWVFAGHGHNFVKSMLRLGRERDTLGVVADQQGGPTSAAGIAQALWHIAARYRRDGALAWGIYHYSGMPACSWHSFACEIFRQATAMGILDRAPHVEPIRTEQYPTPAKRPAWSVLDCALIEQVFALHQEDWRSALSDALSLLQARGE